MNYRKYIVREIGQEEWNSLWCNLSHNNLNQSWEYGEAKASAEGWKPIRFVVEEINSQVVVILQVLTKSWPLFGTIARISRGPLFINYDTKLDKNESMVHMLEIFLYQTKPYKWLALIIALEAYYDDDLQKKLRKIGLYKRDKYAYGSSLITIVNEDNQLLMSLKGKWRNMLRKSQKMDINIKKYDGNKETIHKLIDEYNEFKMKKGFEGTSNNLLLALSHQHSEFWKFKIFTATQYDKNKLSDTSIGAVVVVVHGDTATYLVGFTNEIGRNNNANYLLLWTALIDAKNEGCSWFDVGGLNNNTPKGIAHFKRGLNGEAYILQGEMLYSNYPFVIGMYVWIEKVFNKVKYYLKYLVNMFKY